MGKLIKNTMSEITGSEETKPFQPHPNQSHIFEWKYISIKRVDVPFCLQCSCGSSILMNSVRDYVNGAELVIEPPVMKN